jgi:hypothetical protein
VTAAEARPDRPSRWPRVVAVFLFWSGSRSIYSLVLGGLTSGFQQASGGLFGTAASWGALLHGALSIGAAVAIWVRWQHAVQLIVAALAIAASLAVFEFQRVEADPAAARALYVESRRLRGMTELPADRLEAMFSPAGRRSVWALGAAMTGGPLAVLLWRRRDFEARPLHAADD